MLFNSVEFFLFLPVVFCLYWSLAPRAQNVLLLAASYLFYGSWDWRFLGLIILSSFTDYIAGEKIANGSRPKAWLLLSLVVNLGALVVFKYLDFGIESLSELLMLFGVTPHLPTLRIVLPVGISFYTFQTLSYTIDIYFGKGKATNDPIAFFTFVAFFPQLVAGPIERATSLLPQFLTTRRFDASLAADGARQILYGMFLKVVIADNLAPIVDAAYGDPSNTSGLTLLLATYAFAFQIYGDFAGYSHIAIGCSRLFGVSLRRNFAYPYFSSNAREFWQRWHMSLSTWFRDYCYIPLGGNRCSVLRSKFNVFVTFLLSGLWHGAGFTFIVWGALHGLLVALSPKNTKVELARPLGEKFFPNWRSLLSAICTFHLVCFGWIFFRAKDLSTALEVVSQIFFGWGAQPSHIDKYLMLIPCIVLIEWLRRSHEHPFELKQGRPLFVSWALGIVCVVLIVSFGSVRLVPFIYFQF